MVDIPTNLPSSLANAAIEPIADPLRNPLDQAGGSGSPVDWFLPENSSALREITTPDATGFSLTDVDAITDRILSHIGA